MMRKESKCEELSDGKRYVTIVLDEMKVKEDIVYDKTTRNVIGFCNLGIINDELIQYGRGEDIHPPVAKQILSVMVCGLFFKFDFPLAHFSTEGVTGNLLYPIIWEGIRSSGLKQLLQMREVQIGNFSGCTDRQRMVLCTRSRMCMVLMTEMFFFFF